MTGRPPIYLPSSQSRADKRYHWGTWQECSIPARRLKDHRSCDSDWTTHVFSTEYSWTTQAFRPNLNVSNRSNTNVSNRPNTSFSNRPNTSFSKDARDCVPRLQPRSGEIH